MVNSQYRIYRRLYRRFADKKQLRSCIEAMSTNCKNILQHCFLTVVILYTFSIKTKFKPVHASTNVKTFGRNLFFFELCKTSLFYQ